VLGCLCNKIITCQCFVYFLLQFVLNCNNVGVYSNLKWYCKCLISLLNADAGLRQNV
jgi:hypothetical protein